MAKRTNEKNCFCHTCQKEFHALGIARHRKAHKVREQTCTITYTAGNTKVYRYGN